MLTRDGAVPYPPWSFPAGLDLVDDPSPAGWIEKGLAAGTWTTVGSVVPDNFSAYARVPHPRSMGDLPQDVATWLIELLRDATTTPDLCWFCAWFGWGHMFALEGYDEATYTHVSTPGREYVLLRGGIEMAANFGCEGPSIWWPDDRVWCVGTEIDLDATYVGGSEACIDALIQDTRLGAERAGAGDSLVDPEDGGP